MNILKQKQHTFNQVAVFYITNRTNSNNILCLQGYTKYNRITMSMDQIVESGSS